MNPRVSRRSFLRGLGGLGVALPLMDSIRARADTTAWPTRLVVIYTPNGVVQDAWWPTPGTSETDFTLSPVHQPLAAHKPKLTVIKGMHLQVAIDIGPGEPHQRGMGALLTGRPLLQPVCDPTDPNPMCFVGGTGERTGWGSGISVDQRIAQHVGAGTRFPSLQLGVRTGVTAEVRNRLSYLGSAQPLPPVDDARAAFDSLFADLMTEPAALVRLRAERRSVLDAVQGQFGHVMARISGADRDKLDRHLTMLRDLEMRVTTSSASTGGACSIPAQPAQLAVNDENTMAQIASNQVDVLAHALACDLTRVASLQISSAINAVRYPWSNSFEEGHNLSHAGDTNASSKAQLITRHTWHAERVAQLLDRLDSIPEGDGTVLDHTVVWWVNELSVGNAHLQTNMPFVLAGGANGFFRTGRYLQLNGEHHNKLLVSLLNCFGLQDTQFGHPDYTGGALTQLHV